MSSESSDPPPETEASPATSEVSAAIPENDDQEENNIDPDDDSSSQNVKVCLRLRPMNKLEESRRSRHCVEVREHTSITVNSPLDGSFDCDFNRVSCYVPFRW